MASGVFEKVLELGEHRAAAVLHALVHLEREMRHYKMALERLVRVEDLFTKLTVIGALDASVDRCLGWQRVDRRARPDFVRGHVLLHVGFLGERPTADDALIRFLASVRALVLLPVELFGELLVAVTALVLQ